MKAERVRPISTPNSRPHCMMCDKAATWIHEQPFQVGSMKGVSFWPYCDDHKPEVAA